MSVTLEFIDLDESWAVFDRACRAVLGLSSLEFCILWDAGVFGVEGSVEDVGALACAMLRPDGDASFLAP